MLTQLPRTLEELKADLTEDEVAAERAVAKNDDGARLYA